MNGMELLRKELINRGCTASQVNSKVLPIVLDIVSNSNGEYMDAAKMLAEIRADVYREKSYLQDLKAHTKRLQDTANAECHRIKEQWTECDEYIKAFNKSLEECETAEGRDRLRLAQMYTNSVNIETKYDQTAYIIGLASVISGGNIAPIRALKQINNKIPDPFVI